MLNTKIARGKPTARVNRQSGITWRTLWDKSDSGSLFQALEPTGIVALGSSVAVASHTPSRTSGEAAMDWASS